jgi:hypothetical protein
MLEIDTPLEEETSFLSFQLNILMRIAVEYTRVIDEYFIVRRLEC